MLFGKYEMLYILGRSLAGRCSLVYYLYIANTVKLLIKTKIKKKWQGMVHFSNWKFVKLCSYITNVEKNFCNETEKIKLHFEINPILWLCQNLSFVSEVKIFLKILFWKFVQNFSNPNDIQPVINICKR